MAGGVIPGSRGSFAGLGAGFWQITDGEYFSVVFSKSACICMQIKMYIKDNQLVVKKEGTKSFPPLSSLILLFTLP